PMLTTIFSKRGKLSRFLRPSFFSRAGAISFWYRSNNRAMAHPGILEFGSFTLTGQSVHPISPGLSTGLVSPPAQWLLLLGVNRPRLAENAEPRSALATKPFFVTVVAIA